MLIEEWLVEFVSTRDVILGVFNVIFSLFLSSFLDEVFLIGFCRAFPSSKTGFRRGGQGKGNNTSREKNGKTFHGLNRCG